MPLFTKVVLIWFVFALTGSLRSQPDVRPIDLSSIAVTVSLDGADIRAVQEELNRRVPEIVFNLETDQRDTAKVSRETRDVPLPGLLDEICRALRYEWTFDGVNHAINLFPADTGRYPYYPFPLTLPPIEVEGQDMIDALGTLMTQSPLLGKKYPMLANMGWSETARAKWTRFHGTLGGMTLRQALNWICANSGRRNTCWSSGYSDALGMQTFGFGSKQAPVPVATVAAKTTSLGDALRQAWQLRGRDYLVCAELLDHRGDPGRYLRKPVSPAQGNLTERAAFLEWIAANDWTKLTDQEVVVLVDDELCEISDSPLDVEVPQVQLRKPIKEVIAELGNAAQVGILCSTGIGRLDETIDFGTARSMKLREVLCLLTRRTGIEWIAEITPPSRTVKPALPAAVLLSSPNGFLTLQIVN